jgi:TonB-linked SusC/RagA family outer membrane protein
MKRLLEKKISDDIKNAMKTCLSSFFAVILSLGVYAQSNIRITGTVSDPNKDPMEGVNVVIKGTILGTTTNASGEFAITVASDSAVLQFMSVGYKMQEEPVGNRRIIAVTLVEDIEEMGEITLVAFGTQKKESVLASITTISPKNLKVPSSNLTTAFAGQMAGMISYQSSGEPGADNADFFIRGVTTFGYNVDPLILVDNIEISKSELARIQPDDIESFSLMKDAAATALYGARGANGVILIKTKEGQAGKAQLSVRFENTFSMPTKEIQLADPITYMKMHNEALVTRSKEASPLYSDDKIANTVPGSNSLIYPATDWRDELLKKVASNQRLNMSVRGGGNIARYYVSASFAQDNGILKVDPNNNFNQNINLKTYTLRSNVNIDLTKTTELKVSLDGTFEDYSGPLGSGSDMYRLIMRSNPVLFPAKYPIDEEHIFVKHTMFGNAETGQYLNPYAQMVRGYREYNKSVMGAQMEVNQKLDFIAKGLTLRALFNTKREAYSEIARYYSPYYYRLLSYDPYNTDDYHVGIINPDANGENLQSTIGLPNVVNTMYFESSLAYNTNLAEKHDIGGQLVYTMRNRTIPPLDAAITSVLGSLPYRNVGLAGRFSYGYDARYLTEFNFGLNGSERFSKTHRWGFFPSVSAGWIISNESFFEPWKKTVTLLKLRGSYGLAGNDKISDDRFLYLSDVSLNSGSSAWAFGEEQNGYTRPGISISRYAAPDITWEVSYKTNLALELTVQNDFTFIWEYFTERRTNILQTRATIPYSMGLWNPGEVKANLGEAKGKGTEFSVTYNHSFNKNFWIQARANFTYAVNEYTKYEEYDYINEPWKRHIGTSTTQRFGYLAEGLFIDDAEVANSPVQSGALAGDIKYRDLNGDGVISDRDQTAIGYPTTPEISYGFGPSLGWKSWDFSFFFNGVHRRSFWLDYNVVSPFFNTTGTDNTPGSPQGHNALMQFIADSYWSENNRNPYAVWPRLSPAVANSQNNNNINTWFMRDGAFLRLKQVELGYTLPDKLIKRFAMTGFRVYFTATNLFCISKFKLWDVEMAGNGLAYPIQRGFNIGINVTF